MTEIPREIEILDAEVAKLVAEMDRAAAVAAKPHQIAAGEKLIEARQHFPGDATFWQWAERNFRERTPGDSSSPSLVRERKANCRVRLQHCIDLATQAMWERLQAKPEVKP
jgi:hypothetical protein